MRCLRGARTNKVDRVTDKWQSLPIRDTELEYGFQPSTDFELWEKCALGLGKIVPMNGIFQLLNQSGLSCTE